MENNRIVNGDVFPADPGSSSALGIKVNCGRCGNRCALDIDPNYNMMVNSDEPGKTVEDRTRLRIKYALEHLWKCTVCGTGVDIRSQKAKLLDIVKRSRRGYP
mgnify:CR=1 FL=1